MTRGVQECLYLLEVEGIVGFVVIVGLLEMKVLEGICDLVLEELVRRIYRVEDEVDG
jgi:hypothetical protein